MHKICPVLLIQVNFVTINVLIGDIQSFSGCQRGTAIMISHLLSGRCREAQNGKKEINLFLLKSPPLEILLFSLKTGLVAWKERSRMGVEMEVGVRGWGWGGGCVREERRDIEFGGGGGGG